MRNILIVDDEADIRNLVQGILEDEGYGTALAANSNEAYAAFDNDTPDLVILDIWLQGSQDDGMKILETIKEKDSGVPVIMISGHGTIETAVQAIQNGAYDFIEKPFKSDRLILMVQRAIENAQLKRENQELKLQSNTNFDLIGNSDAVKDLKSVLQRIAPTNSRVLLTGEAGTGKNVAARFIHKHSNRAKMPFMIINCATLRAERLEMELFGAESDAEHSTMRLGVLEQANGGTLLLDEVSDMPMETQAKIVRVLQNQKFRRVGGVDDVDIDVRIIASTNCDLEQAIKDGTFREDLYYRLNVVPVHMPSLRERPDDIPLMTDFFLSQLQKSNGLNFKKFSDEAMFFMQNYHWPGNVRQLKNVLEWVMIMHAASTGETYSASQLPPEIHKSPDNQNDQAKQENVAMKMTALLGLPLRDAREVFEKDYLEAQIERFKGNISKTSQFIGMERSALHRKLKSLNIDPSSIGKDQPADKTKTGS